jgi:hypothetical protein
MTWRRHDADATVANEAHRESELFWLQLVNGGPGMIAFMVAIS